MCRKVKGSWHVRNGDLEALANVLEHFPIRVLADKRDGKTLGTETTGTTDTMEVRVSVRGHVVVNGQVDALDVDTTTEDVGRNTDSLVELLELLVPTDTCCNVSFDPDQRLQLDYLPLLLTNAGVDRDGWEVALAEQLVKLRCADGALDEYNDLVELQVIKQLVELAVLLALFERHEVLLKTVQCQLGVFVDVVLGRVLHELAADGLDLVGKRGAEHHDLLLLRGGPENLLDVTTHVCVKLALAFETSAVAELCLTNLVQHLVALVEHEDADTAQTQVLVANKSVQTSRCTDNDVRVGVLVLEDLGILLDGSATIEDASLDVWHVLGEPVVLVADLESQLTSVAHDQDRTFAGNGLDLLKSCEDENRSLTETRLGLADDITSEKRLGDTCLLNCTGDRKSEFGLARIERRTERESKRSVHRRSKASRCRKSSSSIKGINQLV